MGIVFCGGRGLLLVLPIVVAFALSAGAQAATPPAATVSSSSSQTSFSGHLNATNFFPATCDQSLTPECPPGTNPAPCTTQAEDPINLVCEHFTVIAAESGTVNACVTFPLTFNDPIAGPIEQDVDVFVVTTDSMGSLTLVAAGTTTNDPECVTFAVTAGSSYELEISGFFIANPAGVDISGQVSFTSGGGGGTGGGTGGSNGGAGGTTNATTSLISSNFNGTKIPAGSCIWFNSVLQLVGQLPQSGVTIDFTGSTITFNANNAHVVQQVPNATIRFVPGTSTATITYNGSSTANTGTWTETVPVLGDNVFLDGLMFQAPGGLPGGIQPVKWQGTFSSSTPVQLHWQWGAAVYTGGACQADYNSLGVKPVHSTSADAYRNGDQAGTPENFKADVIGGARGGGGANYTGSYSATASVSLT